MIGEPSVLGKVPGFWLIAKWWSTEVGIQLDAAIMGDEIQNYVPFAAVFFEEHMGDSTSFGQTLGV